PRPGAIASSPSAPISVSTVRTRSTICRTFSWLAYLDWNGSSRASCFDGTQPRTVDGDSDSRNARVNSARSSWNSSGASSRSVHGSAPTGRYSSAPPVWASLPATMQSCALPWVSWYCTSPLPGAPVPSSARSVDCSCSLTTNHIATSPSLSTVRGASSTSPSLRTPETNVPLRLPRSRTVQPDPVCRISACSRDTELASTTRSPSRLRPIPVTGPIAWTPPNESIIHARASAGSIAERMCSGISPSHGATANAQVLHNGPASSVTPQHTQAIALQWNHTRRRLYKPQSWSCSCRRTECASSCAGRSNRTLTTGSPITTPSSLVIQLALRDQTLIVTIPF